MLFYVQMFIHDYMHHVKFSPVLARGEDFRGPKQLGDGLNTGFNLADEGEDVCGSNLLDGILNAGFKRADRGEAICGSNQLDDGQNT